MSKKIDGSFINFVLVQDTKKAIKAGIVKDNFIDTEREQCHISELERELMAFDEEEVFVTTKTFIKYHRNVFTRILEYINKEGE